MAQGKRIAVFSMTPLFPEMVMGGGQAQLKKVALHLGELGHKLPILSTRREDSQAPFRWHENVEILPCLRFKQPYPEPYFTPLYHIANAMRAVGAAIDAADVHYSHDGGLIFPYVYQRKPTVISLRSIIYPETMQCAFLFQGDAWILPSEHTRDSYHAAVAPFAPAVSERMQAIHNGFDWDFFQYTPPKGIFEVIPRRLSEHPILLFPHRPEAAKGIYEVVQIARKLVYERDWRDLRVLVPRWLDADTAPANRDYYAKLRQTIHEAALDDIFYFHDWINEVHIAEYYSLADATLCIGSCVETFGNTVFESLGCGAPVIAARVATYRDLLPDEHIHRVDYGDMDAATDIADDLLRARQRAPAATLAYLRDNFSLEKMVARYADVIVNARKLPPLHYQVPRLDENTRYRLAPWCYVSAGRGIFHDFRSDYAQNKALLRIAEAKPDGFAGADVDAKSLYTWLDEGYVVPMPRHDSEGLPK